MRDYGKTKSTIKPDGMIIDDNSVWVHSNIEPITETVGDTTFEGYQYDMVQYDKNEYILKMSEKNSQFETQLAELSVETDYRLSLSELGLL